MKVFFVENFIAFKDASTLPLQLELVLAEEAHVADVLGALQLLEDALAVPALGDLLERLLRHGHRMVIRLLRLLHVARERPPNHLHLPHLPVQDLHVQAQ